MAIFYENSINKENFAITTKLTASIFRPLFFFTKIHFSRVKNNLTVIANFFCRYLDVQSASRSISFKYSFARKKEKQENPTFRPICLKNLPEDNFRTHIRDNVFKTLFTDY